ncbi:MAG TPA: hypothetical protein VGF23_21360 [Gaiellaceae bacterium]|jgi:hypothetical protein
MAAPESNVDPADQLKRQIRDERDRLADAVAQLREATDIAAKLRPKLPLVAVGALSAGFVVAGGIGATARLLFRRGREGEPKASVGRFSVVERD